MFKIYGVPFSAHTRKVLVGLNEKELAYELEPLVPLLPNLPEPFLRASPLKKIPVLVHGDVAVTDSSVIALYLDRVHGERPLYPSDPALYARALWIEEFVDGGLAEHVLHGLLFQRKFAPAFLSQKPNEALITTSLTEKIPARLAYLEGELGGDWFAGEFSYADVAVASILLNFHYAGETLDAGRYPKLHAFLRRAAERPSFARALSREAPAARDAKILDMTLLHELGY
jgi:glutathione S-transferase